MDIANAARCVPREFINERGNNVTDACIDYLAPLIEGEYPIIFKGGIPEHICI
jgi:6-phosphofructokinase 1